MKQRKIRLADGERILCVQAEYADGPGWTNAPLWVHIVDGAGKLRSECIQPHERSAKVDALFPFLELAHARMMSAIALEMLA